MPRRVVALIALIVSTRAFAQTDSSTRAPKDVVFGATLGFPGYKSQFAPQLLVVGLDVLSARPSRLGFEFALGTMPRAISNGAVVLGGRLDASLPIPLNDEFWLIPVAGGTMIAGAQSGGGDAFGGVNAGIGSILWSGRIGLRESVTWHHFVNAPGAIWLIEFGIVGGR